MCVMYRSVLLVLLGVFAPTEAYQPRWQSPSTPTININNNNSNSNSNNQAVSAPLDGTRRSAMRALPLAFVAMVSPSMAQALDMDAFMAKELDSSNNKNNNKNDGSKKMSDDEALCRFGAPAKETGNACLRAGLPTKRPTGVDAFGSVDRGDFVRCKPNYVDDPKRPGMLINVWDCK